MVEGSDKGWISSISVLVLGPGQPGLWANQDQDYWMGVGEGKQSPQIRWVRKLEDHEVSKV